MQSLHELQHRSKWPSERFTATLPAFLTLLEREWRQRSLFMKTEEQAFFRQAHGSLAGLLDMEKAER